MTIDRIYTPGPVEKKRHTGCYIFLVLLIVLAIGGGIYLIVNLLPEEEVNLETYIQPGWDGFIGIDLSADAPNGPALVNNLLLMAMAISDGNLNAEQIDKLHKILLYPRIYAFFHFDPEDEQERFLVVASLKRMSGVVNKILDQALPDVPSYSSEPGESKPDDGENLYRLMEENVFFLSNNKEFLAELHSGRIPVVKRAEDLEEGKLGFNRHYSLLPDEAFIKGFFINNNDRFRNFASMMDTPETDDFYFLAFESLVQRYPNFWDSAEWLRFSANVPSTGLSRWQVEIEMDDRHEAMDFEKFLRDQYFPRLVKGLEGKFLEGVNVSRDSYVVSAQFNIRLEFLKYLIDSAQ